MMRQKTRPVRPSPHRIPHQIGCLDTTKVAATLISNNGFHCQVWQSTQLVLHEDHFMKVDFVIKKCKRPCPLAEVLVLQKDYLELRRWLGSVVPAARFVATRIDGADSVIVLAETVYPWFNLANPATEVEAVPMLRRLPAARDELRQFLNAATHWYEHGKVIDLYGLDNLVLDRDRRVRYMDSFSVFFYEDLLDWSDQADDDLGERIGISLRRRDYLSYLLQETGRSEF
jgi:hypothetical protein